MKCEMCTELGEECIHCAQDRARRMLKALERIERLKDRWSAPLSHPVGDMSDPAYAGAAAWAAVGSEAHKIATDALHWKEQQ